MSVPAILGTTSCDAPRSALSLRRRRDDSTLACRGSGASSGVADLDSVFKIGIAWQGSRQNRIDRWRSFPLRTVCPACRLPGVRLISLQKGTWDRAARRPGGPISGRRAPTRLEGREDERDFLDTAAVMSLLDLVVTPETAVGHLAGQPRGSEPGSRYRHVGDWRWMVDGDNTPWYPSIRMFRQTKLNDWESVFRRMADALRQGPFCPRRG